MSKATDSEGFPRLMYARDVSGNPIALLADAGGRLVSEAGYTFTNYATNQTTTVIKATAGFLHSVTVNTKGTVASAVTLYDSTAAATNPIAVIDSLNTSGTFTYNCNLVNGLAITTTGTVAANVTVSWR
jgi:hypothetical protein